MYEVVLLIEKPLTQADAHQIADLYTVQTDPVHLHVLLPIEDASARVESALGSIAASEALATSSLNFPDVDLRQIQREIVERSRAALEHSKETLRDHGCEADGEVTSADPVDALGEAVKERGASEVVILTRPHLVAEFFHIDWTSKARRRLGVPCLHLIEHRAERLGAERLGADPTGEDADAEPGGRPANGEPANGESHGGQSANGDPANGDPADGASGNGESRGEAHGGAGDGPDHGLDGERSRHHRSTRHDSDQR